MYTYIYIYIYTHHATHRRRVYHPYPRLPFSPPLRAPRAPRKIHGLLRSLVKSMQHLLHNEIVFLTSIHGLLSGWGSTF